MDGTPIVFDRVTGDVSVGERRVRLPPVEAAVFGAIVAGSGRPVSKDAICRKVWSDRDRAPKAIDVHVFRIRKALSPIGLGDLLGTLWGRGHCVSEAVETRPPADQPTPLTAGGMTLLKELLRECADRPAISGLAERVRQEVFG